MLPQTSLQIVGFLINKRGPMIRTDYRNVTSASCRRVVWMGVVGFAAAWESGGITVHNFKVGKEFPVFGKVVQIHKITLL